jgi:hypothetical protein
MVATCVLAVPALAQDCPELIGRWPYGPTWALDISGDRAYFGSGKALMVADISDSAAPQVVGDILLPSFPLEIAVSGNYAYVADLDAGLRVIDISNPAAPVEVGFLDTPGTAWGVAVSGNYAYVGAADAGLRVIDISNPTAPQEVGFYDTPGSAWGVALSGSHAYVTDYSQGLRIIDVSDPSTPFEVGSLDTPDIARGIAVSAGTAYVADALGGLRIIDVSNLSSPTEVGFVATPLGAWEVAVSGDYAYVTTGDWPIMRTGSVRVVDVSAPSAPVEVAFLDTPSDATTIVIQGGNAYLANWFAGLRVIDVSTPTTPVDVGGVDVPDAARGVAVSGSYAYVADDLDGLRILDVSAPTDPVEVGLVEVPSPWDVAAAGRYAYVAAREEGLRVVDVRTPSAPVEVGFVDTPGVAWGVAVSGGHAYIADSEAGLRVIDVGTPSAPVEVGFIDTPDVAWGVAVSGSYAYVAAGTAGLRVIDVSTPSAPMEIGFVDTSGTAYDIDVADGYAYVVGAGEGLRVFDVSTPSAPIEVGHVGAAGSPWQGVAVSRGYAYVAYGGYPTGGGHLRVFDVSTPSAPFQAGYFGSPQLLNTVEGIGGVAVSGGYVLAASGEAGLTIFADCAGGILPDGRESFIPAAAVAAGAQGAFFQTDVEINNTGTEEAQVAFQWLPRGQDNSEPTQSEPVTLAPGQSLRYENVLAELFSLGPDSLGALKMVARTEAVIGMSRTYNIPAGKAAGTFGQGLPAIRATEIIQGSEPQRIIFLSENEDSRANVGCVNGSSEPVTISIGLFDDAGTWLETRTMGLAPYSNNQINRIFEDYAPVNGYADVWADSDEALYYCYGSMLDNLTSDPTTILPQVPSADVSFIPAAALAAGLEGSFFQTDVDLNNVGSTDLSYELLWLPRGADNSEPVSSETFSLAPGAGVRYADVLDEVFGLEPDVVGALAIEASRAGLLAMSRTYNVPSAKVAGTFGQELPGVPADRMITTGERKRIIFMNENDDIRSNVGCQNGSDHAVRVFIELFNADGEPLETRTMDLAPWSNSQITRVFRNHGPVTAGYVDVWTTSPGATIYCYGSVLDNLTSDPTTVLPQ